RSYLSNNVAGARQEVDKGLKQFPDDVKLKKLDALLKQQQQQNQQQQQKNQQQQKPQRDEEKQAEKDKQKADQTPPGQMSPEEAKRLLDSQKGDESLLPSNHNDKHRDRQLKDW